MVGGMGGSTTVLMHVSHFVRAVLSSTACPTTSVQNCVLVSPELRQSEQS